MADDQQPRKPIQRALLSKADALRQLLGMGTRKQASDEQRIPVLYDRLESSLPADSEQSEDMSTEQPDLDTNSIPLLTEMADGKILSDDATNLRLQLREEADRLVADAIRLVMPSLERQLRDDMEEYCKKTIDRLLEESGSPGD